MKRLHVIKLIVLPLMVVSFVLYATRSFKFFLPKRAVIILDNKLSHNAKMQLRSAIKRYLRVHKDDSISAKALLEHVRTLCPVCNRVRIYYKRPSLAVIKVDIERPIALVNTSHILLNDYSVVDAGLFDTAITQQCAALSGQDDATDSVEAKHYFVSHVPERITLEYELQWVDQTGVVLQHRIKPWLSLTAKWNQVWNDSLIQHIGKVIDYAEKKQGQKRKKDFYSIDLRCKNQLILQKKGKGGGHEAKGSA